MFRKLFVGLALLLGLGFTVSSCAPGVYGGTSVSVGSGYYGPGYYGYGPRYYGGYGPGYYGYGARPIIVNPRPIIVNPRPRFYGGGGYRPDAGFHGGGYGGGSFHGGGYGGGRRGGR